MLWAGPDVYYLRRKSQAVPDPLALYNYGQKGGQFLKEFPEVFPLAWSPDLSIRRMQIRVKL